MRYLLQHGLEESAAEDRDRVAVVDRDRVLTYGQLDAAANRVAVALLDRGVRRGNRVGLYLDKSLESVVGVYGALKAGAAYVPLDPQAPPKRLGYIAADCGVRCLLTGLEKSAAWPELLDAGACIEHLLILNGAFGDLAFPRSVRVADATEIEDYPSAPITAGSIGQDLAYVLYTSGSTGMPKGVMLSHANALAFVEWAVEEFGVGPDDRLSSHAPLQFDLSIFDIFAASYGGATVVLVPPETSYFPIEVARFIANAEISVWYSVPSILNMLVQRGKLDAHEFPRLRTLLFAGEIFPTKYLRELMALLPGVRFCNLYGPTETNVCTCYEVPEIPERQSEPIPIGRAIDGVEVFAITEGGTRASPGETGELYVRGPTVMKGYWGDPDRTRRSLVADPTAEDGPIELVYRTGDLVVEQADGNFRLLGRRDNQIKSRGYRIELGDIEAALYDHPAVVECAVVALPHEVITNTIKAFVVVRDEVDHRALVQFCGTLLPRYMIPETFEFMDALPKTSTGKIDRVALAAEADDAEMNGGRP